MRLTRDLGSAGLIAVRALLPAPGDLPAPVDDHRTGCGVRRPTDERAVAAAGGASRVPQAFTAARVVAGRAITVVRNPGRLVGEARTCLQRRADAGKNHENPQVVRVPMLCVPSVGHGRGTRGAQQGCGRGRPGRPRQRAKAPGGMPASYGIPGVACPSICLSCPGVPSITEGPCRAVSVRAQRRGWMTAGRGPAAWSSWTIRPAARPNGPPSRCGRALPMPPCPHSFQAAMPRLPELTGKQSTRRWHRRRWSQIGA